MEQLPIAKYIRGRCSCSLLRRGVVCCGVVVCRGDVVVVWVNDWMCEGEVDKESFPPS